jgi:hypothetical protein
VQAGIINAIIASSYFLIAVLSVRLIHLPVPSGLTLGLRLSMVSFFVGCGLHHADMAAHGSTLTPVDLNDTHLFIFDLMQVVGGITFSIFAIIILKIIDIRIIETPKEKVTTDIERRNNGD